MAADFFLEIVTKKGGKIKGESLSAACTGQIEVSRFTIALNSPTAQDPDGQHPAAARVNLEEAEFEFETSIASTPLFQTLCTNDVIKEATLTCRRSGAGEGKEATFLQWRLHDARLVSYKMSGADDDTDDTIRIAYAGIEILYRQQKADGSLSANMMAAYDAGENAMFSPTLGKK
ncbi:MAG TPA: type VI secretion system tube protein Hcp [Phycisphaerae bacterium]|jgi:type VI secretion system Hcp family effector|nr:type VI secretion system tube protein Hcp [Phycisphaerae bacterium]